MFCPYCGAKLSDEHKFCYRCGCQVSQLTDTPQSDRSPVPDREYPLPAQQAVSYPSQNTAPVPEASFKADSQRTALLHRSPLKPKYIILAALVLIIAAAAVFITRANKQEKYELASDALSAGRYEEAAEMFGALGGFNDSKELCRYSENCLKYYEAEECLNNGQFSLALENYDAVGDFADASEKAGLCRNNIDYLKAQELTDKHSYAEALEYFTALGDFENSRDMAAFCEDAVSFDSAVALFEEGKYSEARQIFSALTHDFDLLPDYISACDKIDDIKLKLQDMEQGNYQRYSSIPEIDPELLSFDSGLQEQYQLWYKYYDALTKYNSGACYQAMLIFDELGDMADAAARSAACPQDDPKTGEYYHNSAYSKKTVSLKVVMPDDGTKNVVKIYSQTGDLVSVSFVAPGGKITVKLPAGTYTVKNGYSSGTWYGKEDMFGPSGTYKIMTFDNSEYFKLESGYYYTMTLGTTKTDGDPVGEKSDQWSSF